jgi:hypothetical protein
LSVECGLGVVTQTDQNNRDAPFGTQQPTGDFVPDFPRVVCIGVTRRLARTRTGGAPVIASTSSEYGVLRGMR